MRNSNFKTLAAVIGIGVVLVALFAWPRIKDSNRALKRAWKDANVKCLSQGHTNVNLHIHPHLTVRVDGVEEVISAEIGIVPGCMAEVHTHDATGTIHLESLERGKTFTLGQFFAVWGRPIERNGYTLTATVDDSPLSDPAALTLKDGQKIVLEYASVR